MDYKDSENNTRDYYESIPVYFCKACLSLNVISTMEMEFCQECGCTLIESCSTEDWERLYHNRYGHKFLERK